MKTVREHLKDLGYDVEKSLDKKTLYEEQGTMECEKIEIRKRRITHPRFGDCLCVEAVAVVPWRDGTMRPYPTTGGWDKSIEASISLYFKQEKFDTEKYPKTMAYVLERDAFTVRCNRCGSPVLKSDVEGYAYQCMECDEDLYSIETHEGEFHTPEELNRLLLDTRDLLSLDD